jgi:hypothetical protein
MLEREASQSGEESEMKRNVVLGHGTIGLSVEIDRRN